jgi:hypothetical protein
MAEDVEVPRRLTPTVETFRELYLKSGNECAFPGCDRRIMNSEGVFISQLCHIESALPGGERFNGRQTNEERRSFANLMLMCHEHHKITNNVNEYPVERLRQIKAEHEAKFTNVVETIMQSFIDHAADRVLNLPSTFEAMNRVNGLRLSPEEIAGIIPEYNEIFERIRSIPESTRGLLSVAISRGKEGHDSVTAMIYDIAEATKTSERDVYKQVQILEQHKLASFDRDNETVFYLARLRSGGSPWGDLKLFCEGTGISLREMIINLRFDLLD